MNNVNPLPFRRYVSEYFPSIACGGWYDLFMSRVAYLFVLCAFFAAPYAFAAALPGGFAPASLWLSKSTLTDGESANVSTALYDSGDASLSGDIIFTDNGTTFANLSFELQPGESRIYSASWSAKAGSHTLGAALANVRSGTAAASVKDASAASVVISVATPAPPPAATSSATGTAGTVAGAASAVVNAAESVRTAGASALRSQLAALAAASSSSATPSPKVLGASTQKVAAGSASNWFQTFERAALTGLLFVFDSQFWFYLLALFVLYLLYKITRAALGDRRHRYR